MQVVSYRHGVNVSPAEPRQPASEAAMAAAAVSAVVASVDGGSDAGPARDSSIADVVEVEPSGFRVSLANFDGPFDLLLQLIAKQKLDVTEVALHRVTDEFIAYLRSMGENWDLDEVSEFLVVASTLLDLKAARLLPAAAVE